jgi:CcmD family protein
MELGGLGWIFAVNLIIWTGLFVFLLRIERRIAGLEAGGKSR